MEVTAEKILSTSILLSWQPPTSDSINGILMNYLIKVKLNNSIVFTYNTSSTSYNVTGLKKFTNYTFMVSAENQIGEGPSKVFIAVTDSDGKFYISLIIVTKIISSLCKVVKMIL